MEKKVDYLLLSKAEIKQLKKLAFVSIDVYRTKETEEYQELTLPLISQGGKKK